MGATGALIAASTALGVTTSIMQGREQRKEAEYNAALYEEKAATIDVQKNIEYAQYQRLKGRTFSTSMANLSAMGIRPTGSAMAVMIRAQKEIGIDQAIGQFNLEMEKRYNQGTAVAYKRQGRYAERAGYMNSFSNILGGTYLYGKEVGFKK